MTMKTIRNIMLAGFAAVAMSSCSDFLDLSPHNTLDPETTMTDDIAKALTLGCYRTLQSSNMYNQRIWTLDIVAGNSEVGAGGGTDGIETIQGTHFSPEGKHDEADPHLWTSVRNAMTISKNMLDAVIELDPDNAKTYTDNFNNFKIELETLDAEIKAKLAAKQGSAFLVWHPSLSYFARDYGLKQVSLEYEGKEIPIDKLKQNIDAARESKATVLFVQQEFDSRQAETIGNELGVKMIKINPMGYEWESELTKIADAIANN